MVKLILPNQPINAMIPKNRAVMPNTIHRISRLNANRYALNTMPLRAAYRKNKLLAIPTDIFSILAERYITTPSSAARSARGQ